MHHTKAHLSKQTKFKCNNHLPIPSKKRCFSNALGYTLVVLEVL